MILHLIYFLLIIMIRQKKYVNIKIYNYYLLFSKYCVASSVYFYLILFLLLLLSQKLY